VSEREGKVPSGKPPAEGKRTGISEGNSGQGTETRKPSSRGALALVSKDHFQGNKGKGDKEFVVSYSPGKEKKPACQRGREAADKKE